MSNETDKMNYCCDCGWAIRKGFIFKKWYCTCPEIMEKLKKVEISPVNGIKTIEKEKKIECTNLRGTFAYSHLERMPDGRKFCKNYKEKFKGWTYTRIGWWGMPPKPTCPPRGSRNPIPALPEREDAASPVETASFPEFLMSKVQKTKEEKEANEKMIYLETENKALKEAKEELLIILKKTCTLYNINAQCQEYVDECKHGSAQSCSVFRTIQKYDEKDGEK